MPGTVKKHRSNRFVESAPSFGFWIVGLLTVAFIASPFISKTLVSKVVSVEEGEPATLSPIPVRRSPLGALRVDVKARIPTNRWVTYEIQLRNREGEIIASAVKPAWKESGTWREDGESGTWQEEDLQGGLDVRLSRRERDELTVAIAVLEYADISGQDIGQPVDFYVKVQDGAIDTRFFFVGLVGVLSLTSLSYLSVHRTGKTVLSKSIWDSDVTERAIVGGENNLVKIIIDVRSDETSPRQLTAHCRINDGYGQQVYSGSHVMKLRHYKDDKGGVESASGKAVLYFVIKPRGSYGFSVEIMPDGPIDRTLLIVQENAKTLGETDVIEVSAS